MFIGSYDEIYPESPQYVGFLSFGEFLEGFWQVFEVLDIAVDYLLWILCGLLHTFQFFLLFISFGNKSEELLFVLLYEDGIFCSGNSCRYSFDGRCYFVYFSL